MCFYTWPIFSSMIFGCIKLTGARQGKLNGFWTLVCFLGCIAYFWCWNAAHKFFLKINLPSHWKNSSKPRGGSSVGREKFGFPLLLIVLYYHITGLRSMIVAFLGFVSHPFFSCHALISSLPTASLFIPKSVRYHDSKTLFAGAPTEPSVTVGK